MENYSGTVRIKNPKTLRKYENTGKLLREAEQGWIFAKRCGRFVDHICHCSKCRSKKKSSYYGVNGWFDVEKEELEKLKKDNDEK